MVTIRDTNKEPDPRLTAVQTYLSSIFCSITVSDKSVPMLRGEWEHDLWAVVVTAQKKAPYVFEYRTGLGHRELSTLNKGYLRRIVMSTSGISARERARFIRAESVPKRPDILGPLHSMLLDGDTAGQCTFNEWCGDFGYDNDSIEARDTYAACQKTHDQLHHLFTREQLAKLRELMEGY